MQWFKKRKIVLALGGGTARGFANIGVLKVLKREKVPVDLMIGSSIGALIAAGYSLGMPIEVIEKEALAFRWQDLVDVVFPTVAMLKGDKLVKIVDRFTARKTFKDCSIPIAVTATDIETGEELLYTSGDLQKIIQASCSWPGFFPPVEVDGRFLADGGIKNSVPVKWAKSMGATFTIAIKLGFSPQPIKTDNVFHLLMQSFQIMGEELDKYQSMQANVIIDPNLVGIHQLDFLKTEEIIAKGQSAAEQAMPKIRKALRLP